MFAVAKSSKCRFRSYRFHRNAFNPVSGTSSRSEMLIKIGKTV